MPYADLTATGLPIEVRPGDPGRDAIDGVVPEIVAEPRTPEAVAAALAWASERGVATVIRGAGTKIEWGRRPDRIGMILSTRALNRVLAHRAGDLTVSVEAGAPLGDLNRTLSAHRQWLPLDPSSGDAATIGGLLAANDSGPHRHRFGTPRDLVIGIQLATTDGLVTKAGGQVVKNVAGYDLSKLVSGSFGSLAAIVSATFKLSPLPGASGTVVVPDLDASGLDRVASAMASSQLEPVAFDFHASSGPNASAPATCLLRFASLPEVVESQVAGARSVLSASSADVRVVSGDDEIGVWRRHSSLPWQGPGAIARAAWLPADAGKAVEALRRMASRGTLEIIGRAGVGSGLIRIDGDAAWQSSIVEQLRASDVFGNVVLVRAPGELKTRVDAWGPQPNARLLASVKQALDPKGVLGAGRGPL
jgi:glycolate oxidase FAD binding subunit